MTTTLPMSEKELDRIVPYWFIFGIHPEDGTVDIAKNSEDVFTELPPDIANQVVAARDEFKEKLYHLLCNRSKGERVTNQPIDMLLPCPNCGKLHVDAPEPKHQLYTDSDRDRPKEICDDNGQVVLSLCKICRKGESELSEPCWTNPPHKSHLCHYCSTIWRPADVPTNGVAEIKTRGEKDTWSPKD